MSNSLPRFQPDLGSALFLTPERMVRPDWIGHLPFAFFLMEQWRPRRVVELGVFHGDSLCGMCQAAQYCGLETEIIGIDSWAGDIHTGAYAESVLEDLQRHHGPRYGSFSRLERGLFDSQATLFEDNSIDLLHIDGEHTYEAVRHDFETWLPKVRPGGMILFHDTDVLDRPEFGVFKLWEEISPGHASLRFNHCHGLGVWIKDGADPLLEPFASLLSSTDAAVTQAWKSLFSQLGARLSFDREMAQHRQEAEATRIELRTEIDRLAGIIQSMEDKLENFRGMIARRDEKISNLTDKVTKLNAAQPRAR